MAFASKKNHRLTFVYCIVFGMFVSVCWFTNSAVAQIDLLENTLNFNNVTSTNINQTVSENSTNEKDVEIGDFDNDGDFDVVMAIRRGAFGQRKNKIYRNDNGVFNEVSGTAILPAFSSTDVSENAFLRDFDGGRLA